MITMNHVARAETTVHASAYKVWKALTEPEQIKRYMFGATVNSDWKEGSRITWQGEWQGKEYRDKGKILEFTPNKRLQYSHFSPLNGDDDVPENYHIVTIDLVPKEDFIVVSVKQDNNHSEHAKQHSENSWNIMLASMKKLLEENN